MSHSAQIALPIQCITVRQIMMKVKHIARCSRCCNSAVAEDHPSHFRIRADPGSDSGFLDSRYSVAVAVAAVARYCLSVAQMSHYDAFAG